MKKSQNKLINHLYSEKFRQDAYNMLETSPRIKVTEYKNFVDLDLVPFIRMYIEKNQKTSNDAS